MFKNAPQRACKYFKMHHNLPKIHQNLPNDVSQSNPKKFQKKVCKDRTHGSLRRHPHREIWHQRIYPKRARVGQKM